MNKVKTYTGGCAHRLGSELGQEDFFVLHGHCGDDIGETWLDWQAELGRCLAFYSIKVDGLVPLVGLNELFDDLRDCLDHQLLR